MNYSILGHGTMLDGIRGQEHWHFYIIQLIAGLFKKNNVILNLAFLENNEWQVRKDTKVAQAQAQTQTTAQCLRKDRRGLGQ